MKYYFRLSESEARMKKIINGYSCPPIRLYPETPSIIRDFESNPFSDFWGVYLPNGNSGDFADFNTKSEALDAYYHNEGMNIYSIIHDC